MIFVTTGTQLPFPRLVTAMDAIAAGLDEEVVAQVGSDTTPCPNLVRHASLAPAAFTDLFTRARVVVAHAGIGTVLSAKTHNKPLILLPRQHALGEHRNDHQLATARQLSGLKGIHVAWEVDDLAPLLARPDLDPASAGGGASTQSLLARIRSFVDG